MALYTPPSSHPRSPPHHPPMNSFARLPLELVHTWQWRQSKPDVPLTPPLSTIPSRRALAHPKTVLPPIAYLDHALSRHSPGKTRPFAFQNPPSPPQVTPPQADDSCAWSSYGTVSLKLPPVQSPEELKPSYVSAPPEPAQTLPSPPLAFDWFSEPQTWSSHFFAEKFCEMICYLWFSSLSESSSPTSHPKRNCTAPSERSPYIPPSNSATASLQFSVSPTFVRFMQKVLETTQVSQSVVVLSLHYIYRMKARNRFTAGQSGSEYRVAIAALMMANKFLDDNTYTNKTWSEVSGINLAEINRMEKEFLLGIDFGLYVDKSTYESWLNLLQGLVMAKERELHHWRRSWRPARSIHRDRPCKHLHTHMHRSQSTSHRARSTSPRRLVPFATPAQTYAFSSSVSPAFVPTVSMPTGSKRSAEDAFHPDQAPYHPLPPPPLIHSASHSPADPPRRSMGLTLQIPELEFSSGSSSESSASPVEPLQSLAKLSLGASPVDAGNANMPHWVSTVGENEVPRTLVSAYSADKRPPCAAPQNLYFYTLACSPTEEDHPSRKARLRYHQPQPATHYTPPHIRPTMPMVVQSARTSPYDMHVCLPRHAVLPHFTEPSREQLSDQDAHSQLQVPVQQAPHASMPLAMKAEYEQAVRQPPIVHNIPSARFANAGPPGYQLYPTTVHAPMPRYCDARMRHL